MRRRFHRSRCQRTRLPSSQDQTTSATHERRPRPAIRQLANVARVRMPTTLSLPFFWAHQGEGSPSPSSVECGRDQIGAPDLSCARHDGSKSPATAQWPSGFSRPSPRRANAERHKALEGTLSRPLRSLRSRAGVGVRAATGQRSSRPRITRRGTQSRTHCFVGSTRLPPGTRPTSATVQPNR